MLVENIKDILLFTKIVKAGSLCAAGRELGFSSALVSKRLKRLEEQLGVRLVNRSTRTLSITSEGLEYFEYSKDILSKLEEAESFITQKNKKLSGNLRITMPSYFGRIHIAPLVTDIMKQHPNLDVSLHMSNEMVDIIKDGYDLSIRIDNMAISNLVTKPLGTEQRVVVATPGYINKFGTPKTPEELDKHNTLLYANPEPFNTWTFTNTCGNKHIVRVSGNYKINNCESLKELVLSGAGISLRPIWDVLPELKNGELVQLLPEYLPPSFTIQAVYPSRHHLSTRVRTFIDLLKRKFDQNSIFSKDYFLKDAQKEELIHITRISAPKKASILKSKHVF